MFNNFANKILKKQKTVIGGAGYRSRYLSHAKRALYHLSYAPIVKLILFIFVLIVFVRCLFTFEKFAIISFINFLRGYTLAYTQTFQFTVKCKSNTSYDVILTIVYYISFNFAWHYN